MITVRSQQITRLLPTVRAGVRATHLRPPYADDAVQDTLVALSPHLGRLATMPENEARAYVFVAASRTAMAIRKRLGVSNARGSDDEMAAWDQLAARGSESPEHMLRFLQSAQRADRVVDAFATRDKLMMSAIVDEGLSERDAAHELGMSRGSVAYRLRRAREALGRAWVGTTSWAKRRPR